ncbi:MAG TPA: rhodanese-like domain-containing protein [Myxococcota bacterium]|nr:rhodanese-like domain-containing protein [Myxococcota bacterium]
MLAFGLTLAVPALGDPVDSAATVPSLSPAELNAKVQAGTAPVIIDVRTPEEYAASHVPGALNISFEEIGARISEVSAPHGVALYCMVGPRARKGEEALLAAGYRGALYHLEGGLAAWQASGLPVATGQ